MEMDKSVRIGRLGTKIPKLMQCSEHPKTGNNSALKCLLDISETETLVPFKVSLLMIFMTAGLLDWYTDSLNCSNAQILKKRCNFIL